jgi:hypothetical protein
MMDNQQLTTADEVIIVKFAKCDDLFRVDTGDYFS